MAVLYAVSLGGANPPTEKHIQRTAKELQGRFPSLTIFRSPNYASLASYLYLHDGEFATIIFEGGDGAFSSFLNLILTLRVRPTIGYLKGGTLGDVARAWGLGKSHRQTLNTVLNGEPRSYNLGSIEVGGERRYFAYFCAIGTYSDLSYLAKGKHFWKRFSYYFSAFKSAINRKAYNYSLECLNKKIQGQVPFAMVLNGAYAGGFKVNGGHTPFDANLSLFLPSPSFLNGLWHFFFPKKVMPLNFKNFSLSLPNDLHWCLDGEKWKSGPAKFNYHYRVLHVFTLQRKK